VISLEGLISTYGYLAVGVGTFFEGETILVLGSFAAHQGSLELPLVILVAFLGTLCGDQLYFFIGHFKGQTFIEKRPAWKAKSEKVFDLLKRHQILLILGFRFLYGLRNITPFLIGASGIPPLRFLILNIIGALIWATTVGVLGYMLGSVIEQMIGKIQKYELYVFGFIAIAGMLIWLYHWSKKYNNKLDLSE